MARVRQLPGQGERAMAEERSCDGKGGSEGRRVCRGGGARFTRFGLKYHFPQGGMVSLESKGFRREPPAYNEAN